MSRHWKVGFWGLMAGMLTLLGCGGTSAPTPVGRMTVHLVDGPIAGYQEVNLHIQAVEISGADGWVPLGTPNRTINLLGLVGGVEETLVHGATLASGHYDQMRLLLGSGNTVRLADGTIHELTVPSGLQSGLKLGVSFDVAPGTTKDIWIDFDAAHSIQVVAAGASGQYLLRPTIRAFDKVVTGSIHGVLTDATTTLALPGVRVYAETLDASGQATIARSTTTDAAGAYTLDLLPVGATYHVVSQPWIGTPAPKAYDAKASDSFALTSTTPVFTYNAAFVANLLTGDLGGAITPLANGSQSDQVNLLQGLTTPTSGAHTFIVATTMAAVTTTSETFNFATLPATTYALRGMRTTLNPDGTMTSSLSAVVPVTVTAGASANATIPF